MAKSYTQVEEEDYHDTFSLVAKLSTVRIILAFVSVKQWPLHQVNINNGFYFGNLDEEIYMLHPQ